MRLNDFDHRYCSRFIWCWMFAVWLGLPTPTLAREYPIKVVCDGRYPGHLQGFCLDQAGSIYWSFTTWLVKTDSRGKLIHKVPVVSHHGDLCYTHGKVYVAVNMGDFNNPQGKADSWVYVYDTENLAEVARHEVQEVKYGAGGMATIDGRFIVVGGLPHEIDENYLYEYDRKFNFVKKWTLSSGHTHLGIQGTTFAGSQWWFVCYGAQVLRTTDDFNMKGRYPFECGLGIAWLGDDLFYIARGNREPKLGHQGYLLRAVADDKAGLELIKP
jgi:hypothetical protein